MTTVYTTNIQTVFTW